MAARVSKHWNPDEDLVLTRAQRAKPEWPRGATAGLVMLAATCIGIATILYKVAGPRDIIGP